LPVLRREAMWRQNKIEKNNIAHRFRETSSV